MPPEHKKKTSEKEDYGATGQTREKPDVGQGTPMPDGRRHPAEHDGGPAPIRRRQPQHAEQGA